MFGGFLRSAKRPGFGFEPMNSKSHQSGLKDLQLQMEAQGRASPPPSRLKKRQVSPSVRRWRPMPHSSRLVDSPTVPQALGRTQIDHLIRSRVTSLTRDSAEETTALDLAGLSYSLCDEIYRVFRHRH